ncbi:MAG: hypothetical protein M0038_13985 [Pseudomonadota bacterium]|jgi:hypothetical protein|nr:hypothetical protein [Pseudomonadota bacterium]
MAEYVPVLVLVLHFLVRCVRIRVKVNLDIALRFGRGRKHKNN